MESKKEEQVKRESCCSDIPAAGETGCCPEEDRNPLTVKPEETGPTGAGNQDSC